MEVATDNARHQELSCEGCPDQKWGQNCGQKTEEAERTKFGHVHYPEKIRESRQRSDASNDVANPADLRTQQRQHQDQSIPASCDEAVGDADGTREGRARDYFALVLQKRALEMFDSADLVRAHVQHGEKTDSGNRQNGVSGV
jgi:hypothetical protein